MMGVCPKSTTQFEIGVYKKKSLLMVEVWNGRAT